MAQTTTIGLPSRPSPHTTLWVEWRFRSNHPLGPNFYTCDGRFMVRDRGIAELVDMYGDAAISFSGNDFVTGLDIDEFHTYRYESLDGINYRIAVDGQVFIVRAEDTPNGYHYVQLGGHGGCLSDQIPDMLNEWDLVRYGTISYGEQIIATDPPEGYLDPDLYPELDRFTVTFDAPNFVFTDDISVQVTGGVAPEVTWVWRRDDHGPETVEIILDGPIPMDEATTITFNDERNGDTVYYTYIPQPQIPTVSTWGLTAMTLLILVGGTLVFRRIS